MKRIILSTVSFILSTLIFGQNNQPDKLDSMFNSLATKNQFNGNVLIADKGNVIFEKSYGLADEATKRKLNENTIFELASVSKQFTAMGIVILKKQGKLNYDDKISKYIPELTFYKDISVRNLLNHTSGLPDYMDLFEKNWDKNKFATNQDIVDMFSKYKPSVKFMPSEKFEYSNTGYALLALIIERVSKQSFGSFLEKNIFKPLKMKNSFVYRSRYQPKKIENYALGYVTDSIGNKVLPDSFGKTYLSYYLDGIVGDGMVNSTAKDLLIWDRALYSNKLINEGDKKEIFGYSKTNDGKENPYGFGWALAKTEKYGIIANHTGGWAGYITFIERQLTNDKTIIMLQNNSLSSTKLPIVEVRKILYNEPLPIEKALQPATLTEKDLDKYLGVYCSEKIPLKITISKKGNTLYTQATGQQELPMDAYENDIFKFEPAGIKLIFNTKENSFELNQGNIKLVFKKE
ncbi:serine hydrolase domain-containing protein [Chryseobacterium sp. TY4]